MQIKAAESEITEFEGVGLDDSKLRTAMIDFLAKIGKAAVESGSVVETLKKMPKEERRAALDQMPIEQRTSIIEKFAENKMRSALAKLKEEEIALDKDYHQRQRGCQAQRIVVCEVRLAIFQCHPTTQHAIVLPRMYMLYHVSHALHLCACTPNGR